MHFVLAELCETINTLASLRSSLGRLGEAVSLVVLPCLQALRACFALNVFSALHHGLHAWQTQTLQSCQSHAATTAMINTTLSPS